jgi:hypothetical protein
VLVQTLDDGAFRFVKPDGRAFDSPLPPATDGSAIRLAHERAELRITPSTAVTRRTGEALDLALAVGGLMQADDRRKNVSAERPRD